MIYLSRSATLQSSARSGSRRNLPLRVHLKKVPAPVNVLLLDSLHRELKAKLRKQDRAAIEQVVWLRTSWQARRHGDEIRPLSNRCDSSCQGFGPHHHHHSTSTLWVTRTLSLFFLIKIKGSHSHVQAVLMIGQYGNQVIERWGYSSSHRH